MKTKQRFLNTFLATLLTPLLVGVLVLSPAAFADDNQEIPEPAPPARPELYGKVAVLQWVPPTAPIGITKEQGEQIKQQNRVSLAAYIRDAAAHGAVMVVTSEFGIVGYPDIPGLPPEEQDFRNREDIAPYVEPVPGPSTQFFGSLAKELKVYIQIGFAEVDPRTDQYFNVAVVLAPNGEVAAKYRKINLYQLENKFLSAGHEAVAYISPFGLTGLIVCADVYSNHPMTSLRNARVHVLALSTSWAEKDTAFKYFREGAQYANAFLLAANQPYFPDSGVINPDGSFQSHIHTTVGLAYGYLPIRRFDLMPKR